ncbi:hypothetical protein [Variovorax paradoxus]|uniref:hypothetical protein n=1 Tax=Variovorax paradoxus TaxID=34073 RepID=UPI0024812E9E|nr:hypothetical protein [Variovorax paradoxus]WGT61759.1 hypothetical protein QHG62_16935 [Variovorax paradoxus]WGT61786.1 hypothetical protein QHG62_17075 [Variovorax paradoxus]
MSGFNFVTEWPASAHYTVLGLRMTSLHKGVARPPVSYSPSLLRASCNIVSKRKRPDL